MKIITTLLISLFMSFGLVQMASAEITIQAFVSDTNIVLGQQIILNVSINDIDAKYQLDSEPLNNNFQVFLPSQSRQNQNINGKISKKTTWRIPLKAKKTGQLLIPSLSVGPLKTKPIQIQVKTYSATTSNISKVVFMQNKLDKDSVYIGQTFTLTSMIFISKDTDNLELSPPFADNASIELQQEDKNGIVIRNGIRYQTITRQYKITPNKAGKISIIPPFLSGSLRNIIQINQWQNKIISEPINIQGKALKITVKAIPKNFKTEWIISEDLRLIEHTDLTKQSYHVGDPITRTVTLEIASVDKDKLPTINFNYPDALRNYPDKDIFSQQITNGLTYATRTFKHVIIADKTGPLILPEIKITWWNSQTDQQQITTLPTQTLTILAEERTYRQ
ncbi:BatD family protein [Psychromonas sp. CD1]|uniref:BatD family protein n=1 Tax=Psychromonas sp. CD1 TaxID=1979839 RepID=UPI000B9AEC43|nr:BatD family protein [Psychromonas sp. CD1]